MNASLVTSIYCYNNLLVNEIQDTGMSVLKLFFCSLRVLVRKHESPSGHLTKVSSEVQLLVNGSG